MAKTHALASLVTSLHARARAALDAGVPRERIDLGPSRDAIAALRDGAPAEREALATAAAEAVEGLWQPGAAEARA